MLDVKICLKIRRSYYQIMNFLCPIEPDINQELNRVTLSVDNVIEMANILIKERVIKISHNFIKVEQDN